MKLLISSLLFVLLASTSAFAQSGAETSQDQMSAPAAVEAAPVHKTKHKKSHKTSAKHAKKKHAKKKHHSAY